MFGRTKRERLDCHRGVIATTGDEAAAVHDVQVGDIVRAMVLVDDRRLRIIPHSAGGHGYEHLREVGPPAPPTLRSPPRPEESRLTSA